MPNYPPPFTTLIPTDATPPLTAGGRGASGSFLPTTGTPTRWGAVVVKYGNEALTTSYVRWVQYICGIPGVNIHIVPTP